MHQIGRRCAARLPEAWATGPAAPCYSDRMSAAAHRLTVSTVLLLMVPPLMWAGNAVVGRLASAWLPPFTLNALRWVIAFALLLPLAWRVLAPGSALWPHWRRFSLLGLTSVAGYNTFQYLALATSTPINVTLVASSMPVWMLLVGRLLFAAPVTGRALAGAACSLAGVFVVLSRGDPRALLAVQLVPGDLWMLVAAVSWASYSWLLTQRREPEALRADWAAFLLGQVVFGLGWSALLCAGEWAFLVQQSPTGQAPAIAWSWALAAALLYVAVGPSLLAYRCWGAGVSRIGPTRASFFTNLTPLFAALLSTAVLGETPHAYHGLAFLLIVAGIVVTSVRR